MKIKHILDALQGGASVSLDEDVSRHVTPEVCAAAVTAIERLIAAADAVQIDLVESKLITTGDDCTICWDIPEPLSKRLWASDAAVQAQIKNRRLDGASAGLLYAIIENK